MEVRPAILYGLETVALTAGRAVKYVKICVECEQAKQY